jgi:hypothetical protein
MYQRVSSSIFGGYGGKDTEITPSYRTTLNQREKLTDDEEREHVLKACHKRCAVRTLKVLERNGGIFIKLGQHLVWLLRNFGVWRAADVSY